MLHLSPGAFRFEISGLQLEIPFGGTIGIVNQHEMRIVLQAFGLQFHGAAILLDEFREDEFEQARAKRHPAEKIPGGDDVDAALVARNGRDRRQDENQYFPARMVSQRKLGRIKSMVVVMESAAA